MTEKWYPWVNGDDQPPVGKVVPRFRGVKDREHANSTFLSGVESIKLDWSLDPECPSDGDIMEFRYFDDPQPLTAFVPKSKSVTAFVPKSKSVVPEDVPTGNTDANGEGKQTNPKDAIGAMKAKLSVVPTPVLYDLGLAMLEGAVKYGRHNYRVGGVRASVYYDAAMGHLMDWWDGQDIDQDSGLSHVTKAIASLVVLRDAMFQGKLIDDRPPRAKVSKKDFNDTAAAIITRHNDKSPRHFTIGDTQ